MTTRRSFLAYAAALFAAPSAPLLVGPVFHTGGTFTRADFEEAVRILEVAYPGIDRLLALTRNATETAARVAAHLEQHPRDTLGAVQIASAGTLRAHEIQFTPPAARPGRGLRLGRRRDR